jgi:serine/threonine protein phosphatase PrpC
MVVSLNRERGVEWSVISRARPGEAVCGDQHVVVPTRDGVLLAVIDGLGHGDEATIAARRAVDVFEQHSDRPVLGLLQESHAALRDTRGAAMTVVSVDRAARIATAVGVGNVEAVLVHADPRVRPARESILLRNGVVGYQLPPLQTTTHAIGSGDVLVFATDGIRDDFGDSVGTREAPADLVERILAEKFRGTDDALVLACRILPDHET